MATAVVTAVAGSAVPPRPWLEDANAALTAEERRIVAFLLLGLLLKISLVATLVGFLVRGCRAVWYHLRRGGRR